MQKIHWTNRPENKAKLKKMLRAAAVTRAKKNAAQSTPATETGIPDDTFAYALGHVECWLDTYAKSAGVPAAALTARLGKVLQSKASR